ncbi:hypothetical protein [Lactococcus termiticola]|uniref:SseB protein N-terminal domain-containing protein n=1 Tax=Lactococcus termiticola TaxID=2169526 RepID=A0A2R5HGL0_9LACT|nr:hypothetical protein [Lactococcus termiticola]GBG96996.1 hypothetical protein NtB2_01133 [Lactococcus termiticola]
MKAFNINPELHNRIKASLQYPGDFLLNIGMTYALQSYAFIAPSEPFYLHINEKNILPIFTNEEDFEKFKEHVNNEEVKWVETSVISLLDSIADSEIDTLGINVDLEAHKVDSDHAFFDKLALMDFIREYTEMMNTFSSEENQQAAKLDQYFFVPAFTGKNDEGEILRSFPLMTAGDNKKYAPVFDNLDSLQIWYRSEFFGLPFTKDKGDVVLMKLSEIEHPADAKHILDDASGVTINPLDVEISEYKKTIIPFNMLTKPDYD